MHLVPLHQVTAVASLFALTCIDYELHSTMTKQPKPNIITMHYARHVPATNIARPFQTVLCVRTADGSLRARSTNGKWSTTPVLSARQLQLVFSQNPLSSFPHSAKTRSEQEAKGQGNHSWRHFQLVDRSC